MNFKRKKILSIYLTINYMIGHSDVGSYVFFDLMAARPRLG
ncbi:hypothetical protein J2X69_004331 [Algoriphagus sp. 4150]|nr:hypothetical protein [Algoriphagus sp. 4150]